MDSLNLGKAGEFEVGPCLLFALFPSLEVLLSSRDTFVTESFGLPSIISLSLFSLINFTLLLLTLLLLLPLLALLPPEVILEEEVDFLFPFPPPPPFPPH